MGGDKREAQWARRVNRNMQPAGVRTGRESLKSPRHQGWERLPGPSEDNISQNNQQQGDRN